MRETPAQFVARVSQPPEPEPELRFEPVTNFVYREGDDRFTIGLEYAWKGDRFLFASFDAYANIETPEGLDRLIAQLIGAREKWRHHDETRAA